MNTNERSGGRVALAVVAFLVAAGLIAGVSLIVTLQGGAPHAAPSGTAAPTSSGTSPPPQATGDGEYERGINVYSLEMNRGSALPATEWGEPQASYDYLAERGMSIVRLAFSWSMLQPVVYDDDGVADFDASMDAPIDETGMRALQIQVERIAESGLKVVLDLHNGCSYPWGPGDPASGKVYCGAGISIDQQVRIWQVLSDEFKDNPAVYAYDLFNEPRDQFVEFSTYREYSQAVVDAIRENNDDTRLWVPAMIGDWSLAGNAKDGPWILDSSGDIDHSIVYSEHFYASGVDGKNVPLLNPDGERFLAQINRFGQWCVKWEVECSIGEIGWPSAERQTRWKGSAKAWNDLGDRAYDLADEYALDVTYFGTMSTADGYFWAYDSSDPGIPSKVGLDKTQSQAKILERHLSSQQ